MYYAILLNGTVIDSVSELACCKFSDRSGVVLRCDETDTPDGIISERTGLYYHVDGWPRFPDTVTDSGGTVELKEVDDTTYEALIEALNGEQAVNLPDPPADLPPNPTLEYLKDARIRDMSTACNAAIVGGVDVVLSDGQKHHFSLSVEDQLNILSLSALLMQGQSEAPYHADGEPCKFFSAADLQTVATAATAWKMHHESYFNSLKAYILSMSSAGEIATVAYGMEIPHEYRSQVLLSMEDQP